MEIKTGLIPAPRFLQWVSYAVTWVLCATVLVPRAIFREKASMLSKPSATALETTSGALLPQTTSPRQHDKQVAIREEFAAAAGKREIAAIKQYIHSFSECALTEITFLAPLRSLFGPTLPHIKHQRL